MLRWLTNNRFGTYLTTRFSGDAVGEDEVGNKYYRARGAKHWRQERRWVVYVGKGEIDASSIPPGWNAWLHKNRERSPAEEPLKVRHWEKEHVPNLTGTIDAYVPAGHEKRGGKRDRATGDYEPWRPGS